LDTLFALIAGTSVVVIERFDAAHVLDAVQDGLITCVSAVPTMLRRMLAEQRREPRDLSGLTGLCTSAAPCPPSLKEAWIDLVGPDAVRELYTGSEFFGSAALDGREALERPGSVGRGYGTEIRIVDASGRPLPAGEIGEVFMRPLGRLPRVTYRQADPPTEIDGFYSFGDLGRLDEDGYLYLADRRSDLIISGGSNVVPAEVEAALCEHPAVADAVVFGVADEEWGQVVSAAVELVPGAAASEGELRDHCRGLLAAYKVPKSVEIVSRLPRAETGKIRRADFREAAEQTVP
jgi:bile acid-coenzyme A ligase